MNQKDPHRALKSELLTRAYSQKANLLLVKLYWGKSDIGYSLHIAPSTFSFGGLQFTDFLNLLGFKRGICSFVDQRECYVRWVNEGFDVAAFADSLDKAYATFIEAQRELEQCGYFFPQPESGGIRPDISMHGDGHTALESKSLNSSEDESFRYKLTWIENNRQDSGWVIHYIQKHSPLSSEIENVFRFLGIRSFPQCPEYDFEPCHWRSIAFVPRGDGFLFGNSDSAHQYYKAHEKHFSSGLRKLLDANVLIEKFGFGFLPFPSPQERNKLDIERQIIRPKNSVRGQVSQHFDIAISFAGTERVHAERLANHLKEAGVSVFYDAFYPEELWGKNLVEFFDEIYRKRASYCVMFISKEYKERMWTVHERRSAQARALQEKNKEYILPIKVDDTDLEGMAPTIGYVSLEKGIDEIAKLLLKKLT